MTRETNPLVSIGVPVWNGAIYLREALDSLIGQTYGDFELIISDNASVDETESICKEYATKDKRIRYVKQKNHVNPAGNFNFLLREARGKYFMWSAHDDIRDKRFIEKALGVFEKNPDLTLVFSGFERFDEKSSETAAHDPYLSTPTDEGLYPRLKNYILFYWVDGKGAPIYGLWRMNKITGDKMGMYLDWVLDTRFIFRSLSRGGVEIIDEVLFRKRSDFSRKFVGGFMERIFNTLAHRTKRLKEHLFHSDAVSFIWVVRGLSAWQRAKLTFWHFWVAARLFLRRKM